MWRKRKMMWMKGGWCIDMWKRKMRIFWHPPSLPENTQKPNWWSFQWNLSFVLPPRHTDIFHKNFLSQVVKSKNGLNYATECKFGIPNSSSRQMRVCDLHTQCNVLRLSRPTTHIEYNLHLKGTTPSLFLLKILGNPWTSARISSSSSFDSKSDRKYATLHDLDSKSDGGI